jgi:hypothetical protein
MQKLMERIQHKEGLGRGTGGNCHTANSGIRRKWESTYRKIIKFSTPMTENQGEKDAEDFEMDEAVMYARIVPVGGVVGNAAGTVATIPLLGSDSSKSFQIRVKQEIRVYLSTEIRDSNK